MPLFLFAGYSCSSAVSFSCKVSHCQFIMCFKIKFAANPFKCLIDRPCNRPACNSHTICNKHILLYEHNAFTSHLMLDSDEVYQMTKRGLDAAQIAAAKGIHLNLVLVKLLELHHLGYDLRHYHAQHHAFIKQFNLPAHFQFDVAAG